MTEKLTVDEIKRGMHVKVSQLSNIYGYTIWIGNYDWTGGVVIDVVKDGDHDSSKGQSLEGYNRIYNFHQESSLVAGNIIKIG